GRPGASSGKICREECRCDAPSWSRRVKEGLMRTAVPILTRLALLVGFCGLGLGVVTAADPLPRLPRDNLLVYRGPEDQPVPVRTAQDWSKRRDEVVRGMESVMGKLPGKEKRCALDPKTEDEVDCGTYVRRFVTYASEPGCRVPAYL